jgi:hypothetical protein
MFEISATFDMLRRNLPTFILPDLSVNIIDTIASISYCFVCKRNEICKFSYKEGLCHDCFNAKYDLKLCVVCNKKTTRGDCAKVATRNKEMKLRQKSVWLATETKPGAREDCAEVATRNKVVMV